MRRSLLVVAFLLACASQSNLPPGEGLTRPEQISGDLEELYRAAGTRNLTGKLSAKCVLTKEGTITGCKIIVPATPSKLDLELIEILETWRFKPSTFKGEPVTTDYVFHFDFVPKQQRDQGPPPPAGRP